jgi:uncharacterized protein (TIGR00106 family)
MKSQPLKSIAWSVPSRIVHQAGLHALGGDHNRTMKVIADLCVVPIGVGVSVSKEVAMCERILAAAGLKTHLHAYGTNIEGDWDQVFAAVKQCHEALHAAGVPRISTSMRFGTRTDREQMMEDKVRSVEEKL